MSRKKSYMQGIWAERFAAFYLRLKGYRILSMRYKTSVGEVDIVANKRNILVMVEVKARKNITDALESISPRSQKRIEKTAGHYLATHLEYAKYDVRLDVIAIQMRWPFLIKHLDNAWQARP